MAKSVLVLEPDRAIRRLVEVNLARQGYRVRLAWTAQEAFWLIAEERPDLIVTDAEGAEALAEDPLAQGIPIVRSTG